MAVDLQLVYAGSSSLTTTGTAHLYIRANDLNDPLGAAGAD